MCVSTGRNTMPPATGMPEVGRAHATTPIIGAYQAAARVSAETFRKIDIRRNDMMQHFAISQK
jgi:hypothetical protein